MSTPFLRNQTQFRDTLDALDARYGPEFELAVSNAKSWPDADPRRGPLAEHFAVSLPSMISESRTAHRRLLVAQPGPTQSTLSSGSDPIVAGAPESLKLHPAASAAASQLASTFAVRLVYKETSRRVDARRRVEVHGCHALVRAVCVLADKISLMCDIYVPVPEFVAVVDPGSNSKPQRPPRTGHSDPLAYAAGVSLDLVLGTQNRLRFDLATAGVNEQLKLATALNACADASAATSSGGSTEAERRKFAPNTSNKRRLNVSGDAPSKEAERSRETKRARAPSPSSRSSDSATSSAPSASPPAPYPPEPLPRAAPAHRAPTGGQNTSTITPAVGFHPRGPSIATSDQRAQSSPLDRSAPPTILASSDLRRPISAARQAGEAPKIEAGEVEQWLLDGDELKEECYSSDSIEDMSKHGLRGPLWIEQSSQGVDRLVSPITPAEAEDELKRAALGVEAMQQLGEDPDSGTMLERHLYRMNQLADRAIVSCFRSTSDYIGKLYASDALLPWARRRLLRPDSSRLHFLIWRPTAHRVVPALVAGNAHLHERLRQEQAAADAASVLDPSDPFYTWSVIDSNASDFVHAHSKRRVYTDWQYRRITVVEGSMNPSAAGEAMHAAVNGQHTAANTSTETALSVTVPTSSAGYILRSLDRYVQKKKQAGSICLPDETAWRPPERADFVPDLLADANLTAQDLEKLLKRYLIDRPLVRIERLRGFFATAALPPRVPVADRPALRKATLVAAPSTKRAYTINSTEQEVTRLLSALYPKPGETITVWCDGCRTAITIVRRAGALGHTVTHPTSKNPTCRDVFCLLFRHRHIKYDYKLLPPGRFGVVSEELLTVLNPPTPNTPAITVTGLLFAWYDRLQDHVFGDEAIIASISAFVDSHKSHWGAHALGVLIQSRNRLGTMLYQYFGPSIFYGGARTIGLGGSVCLAGRKSALYAWVVNRKEPTSAEADPPLDPSLSCRLSATLAGRGMAQAGESDDFLFQETPQEGDEDFQLGKDEGGEER